ncbi:MAG: M48 family metalloprotease [Burkholderiales bacterium]|nr:M48 family metalloprotease [Burkholderiales bacterium]
MDTPTFERMVARLETESAQRPGAYQAKVALLALLGFGLLALVVGMSSLGLLLLAGAGIAMLMTGGKAIILLLKLGKLLILLAIPLWLLLKSSMQALFVRLPAPEGRELQRDEAPALFDAMDRMRERMKGPRFHHVLLTDEVNAAVVQRPAFGLFGWPRNYLLLGLPLLEAMTPDEALAVVAHEYGHLAGSHGRFGAFIYRLRLTWATIQAVTSQWPGWAGSGARKALGWYVPYFNAYTFVLARANEYQADRASADLVGADVAAHALKRVNLAGPRHERFLDDIAGGVREQAEPPPDLTLRWAAVAADAPAAEQARGWLDRALQRLPMPQDTHPALRDRLQALRTPVDVAELPPLAVGTSAAQAWLGAGLDALRHEFARNWLARVQPRWRERHAEVQTQREELAGLLALEAPDRGQQLRRIQLQQNLDGGFEAVPALVAFNAAHADDAAGLFHEGSARLDAGDATGLALLERAMALDADATKPACQLAFAFLSERGDARAKDYVDRWQRRDDMEMRRERQATEFSVKHELVAPDELGAAALQRCRELLAADPSRLAEAYVARRVLPADPTLATYVIGVRLGTVGRFFGRSDKVVKQLAALDWPMPCFVVALEKDAKPLRKRMQALAGARLV